MVTEDEKLINQEAIHPPSPSETTFNPTQSVRGAGAFPSCHWEGGGVHSGQVASKSGSH